MKKEYIKSETEIWKVFKDTSNHHKGALWQVSDQGNVKRNGKLYECRLDKKGYKVFIHISIHRAVAELFVPNPNNYNEVDHINGNPLDNRALNLRWCTHKQNCNNPITRKRYIEANKGKHTGPQSEEAKRKNSESHKNKHRVYHPDGTYHYEK